jgi:hypothetical protein
MPGGECDGVVEKEDRCPVVGSIERHLPRPVRNLATDPPLTLMVTRNTTLRVHQAPTVSCEAPASFGRMKVTEGIDSILSWHQRIMARLSLRIVENDAEYMPGALAQDADAMTHTYSIHAA